VVDGSTIKASASIHNLSWCFLYSFKGGLKTIRYLRSHDLLVALAIAIDMAGPRCKNTFKKGLELAF